MRGRKAKPTHLKVVSGTVRKHRENPAEPTAATGIPQPPDWLSERATTIFYETVAAMDRMGTISPDWGPLIAEYASAREEIEVTTGIIEDLGRVYTTTTATGDTMFRPRPEVTMRSDAMRRSQMLRAELGLGPASKSRVSASTKKEANPFKALA